MPNSILTVGRLASQPQAMSSLLQSCNEIIQQNPYAKYCPYVSEDFFGSLESRPQLGRKLLEKKCINSILQQ